MSHPSKTREDGDEVREWDREWKRVREWDREWKGVRELERGGKRIRERVKETVSGDGVRFCISKCLSQRKRNRYMYTLLNQKRKGRGI